MATENKLTVVSPSELTLVTNNILNENQLSFLLKKTPDKYLKKRPGKGGGDWTYVSGGYVKKCLNLMFGWDWDFEILEQLRMDDEAIVKGKLTCRTNGRVIVKMQFGNKDIAYKTETRIDPNTGKFFMKKDKKGQEYPEKFPTDKPLSIGNDFKAAATDCLKKCAAELGIASDVYNVEEFREVQLDYRKTITLEDLQELFELKKEFMKPESVIAVQSIIDDRDEANYKKTHNNLSKL